MTAAVSATMRDWYTRYYRIAPHSPAHADFCRRVYGRDLCQHGCMDMPQLERLIEVLGLQPGQRALELGCGDGRVAEIIADATGAHIHGLDYIPEAIAQALDHTRAKRDRLTFAVSDMNALDFPPASFDAIIAIDTLYFSDLTDTIGRLKAVLRPGGRIGAYYTHMLWDEADDRSTLLPGRTPLALALEEHHLSFQTWDYSCAEYERSCRVRDLLPEFQLRFKAQDALFLYENRAIKAEGNIRCFEAGRLSRYLYLADLQPEGMS